MRQTSVYHKYGIVNNNPLEPLTIKQAAKIMSPLLLWDISKGSNLTLVIKYVIILSLITEVR